MLRRDPLEPSTANIAGTNYLLRESNFANCRDISTTKLLLNASYHKRTHVTQNELENRVNGGPEMKFEIATACSRDAACEGAPGKPNSNHKGRIWRSGVLTFASCMMLADQIFAQSTTSPWTQAVQALQTAFTGPIATGLALVAIVVGGLMFAFGEGAAKRTLAGVIFGVGMAVGAVNFMSWLFP